VKAPPSVPKITPQYYTRVQLFRKFSTGERKKERGSV
jgi:hypothetical protein